MKDRPKISLPDDRYFGPDPQQKEMAQRLYATVADLPLVCPHSHVDPRLFADPDYTFGTPTELFLIPDHYIFRMLYSQGIPLEKLGIPRLNGGQVERDHRQIWQTFAENFYLFRGTPTGIWITQELHEVFGIEQKLSGENAQDIYDQIVTLLAKPEFRPRALYERFKIEVLCTTDQAWDSLEHHKIIRSSGWEGDIRPTFRPDGVLHLGTHNWKENIQALSESSGISIHSYSTFIEALEEQRTHFKSMGATATDHATLTPFTGELSQSEAESIFQRALRGESMTDDDVRFTGHILMEMARMSVEDGLVMQLHPGSWRDHNPQITRCFGRDKGADIPVSTEFTSNLKPLLDKFGCNPRFRLILFTLDEATYARELAPLAGHYPSVLLGPPWWFHDSLNGMCRYFDRVMETGGLYNTVGFNDDTRAFLSIPARHDLWRRAACNWVAGLVVRHIVDEDDAHDMVGALAYNLSKRAYNL